MSSPPEPEPGCQEIERKFLVEDLPEDLEGHPRVRIVQGYLTASGEGNEVRLRQKGDRCYLTIKSRGGIVRSEGEIEVTRSQIEALWPFVGDRVVEKVRYQFDWQGRAIEVDVYEGRLKGLVVAEVEFASLEESRMFVPPSWFGAEVTLNTRYRNESLALYGTPA